MIAIEKLKQAALAATQGEWIFDKEDNHISSDGRNTIAQPRSGATISTEQRDRNGDYIATANPSAIIELITRLEAAESQLEAAEILQARDERVAEACCKVVDDVVDTFGAHSLVGVVKAKIRSCEWRKYL